MKLTADEKPILQNEIQQVVKKQNEFKQIGSQKKIPGHTLFSFNTKTGEIKKAAVERSLYFDHVHGCRHTTKIKIEPDCYYEQALNEKNFIKRLIRKGIVKIVKIGSK